MWVPCLHVNSDDLRGLPGYFYVKQAMHSYFFKSLKGLNFFGNFKLQTFLSLFGKIICQQQVTQKLLEAEKKKLTQLELQLDEDTAKHGISSVEKVITVRLMMLLIQCLVL